MRKPKQAAAIALALATAACSQPDPTNPAARYTPPNMAEIQARAAAIGASMAKTAADCPWPATGTYAHTRQVFDNTHRPAAMSPATMHAFTTGCALITFTVDDDGAPANARILSANPPASGPPALQIVQRNMYARGDAPAARFLLRIGLEQHPDGSSSVSEMSR